MQQQYHPASMVIATWLVATWMIAHGYATGHGDTVEDMLVELEGQAKERGMREKADV
jgi:hypothetical protein